MPSTWCTISPSDRGTLVTYSVGWVHVASRHSADVNLTCWTVESVRAALDGTAPTLGPAIQSFEEGRGALDHNTDTLFGPRPAGRVSRIMVTLPTEAADDYSYVKRLVSLGMDVARINGAHDDPDVWERMARPRTPGFG